MTELAISLDDIEAAANRLKGFAVRTPLIENQDLNDMVGGRLFIKAECLQRTGSFKFRGAYNRLSQLSESEKKAGVVAFSSGNHAQGVACAAKMLGIHAAIVMPSDAPAIKMENTRGYGAEVILYDRVRESREEIAKALTIERGCSLVPSYEDAYIMAGQGTVGLEIAEDLGHLGVTPDQVMINCGGGGLTSGSVTALKASYPDVDCYTVEPEGYDDASRSLASGVIEDADLSMKSACDALLSPQLGTIPFAVLRHFGVQGVSVSDAEAFDAMRVLARHTKLIGEPGGVVSIAAALTGKIEMRDKISVVIISGGNVDLNFLSTILVT